MKARALAHAARTLRFCARLRLCGELTRPLRADARLGVRGAQVAS